MSEPQEEQQEQQVPTVPVEIGRLLDLLEDKTTQLILEKLFFSVIQTQVNLKGLFDNVTQLGSSVNEIGGRVDKLEKKKTK